MTEHLTNRQIERYHQRTLDPAELLRADKHLTACAECRRGLNFTDNGKEKFSSLRKVLDSVSDIEHLDYKQLAAFADGSLTSIESEVIEDHLATCGECELLANDLVVFKDEIAHDLNREYVPPATTTELATPQSFSEKLTAFFRSKFAFNSPALAFGMGALAMLIVGGFVWLLVRVNRTGTTSAPIVQSPSPVPATSPLNSTQASASPLPSPSPQLLMAVNDGANQVGIDERGNLVGLDDLPPGTREMVKTALISQQAANLGAIAGLGGPQGVLRGGGDQSPGFAPISPVAKIIFSVKPALRWSKLEGAIEYRVEIYDSNFSLIESSPPLTSNTWSLPRELNRGEIYSWQVTALKDGVKIKTPVPPAPEAKFKTLDAKQAADLTAARKNYSSSHLALGVLYAQVGLLEEAEAEFSTLLSANPKSDVAQKLLNNVKAARKAGMK